MPRSTRSSAPSVTPSGPAMPTEAETRAADLAETAGNGTEDATPPSEDGDDRDSRIRKAAYAAYQRRGSLPGQELDDWLEAERSLRQDTKDG